MSEHVWLAVESQHDSETIHGAFADEDAAHHYADQLPYVSVEQVALYGPGQHPTIVTGWTAKASVQVNNPSSSQPPTVEKHTFSEAGWVPDWARQPCTLADCSMPSPGRTLEISYHGADRDAVLAACQERYDKAVAALS